MTFCIGIKVAEGLIALADGRITAGAQVTSARKMSMHGPSGQRFLVMTSGLRSVRDKTVAYFEREMAAAGQPFPSMLDAVGAFCRCLRRVMAEDKAALADSGLKFNLHAILGGQLADDREPMLFLIYPEGNWIQVDERTPYLSIGATAYGKPILDRALKPGTTMASALKIAYLSFDSSRVSSADVGFPLDMVTFSAIDRVWREAQFDDDDLRRQRQWWNTHIKGLVDRMPEGPWASALMPDADWT
ncbi:MAG: peptidase [Alphaproteobacteria bacterium]|nr:peptidase [Alphaproteobacteria bacterium]TAD87133.1 MAG: peptidase [Alphaproteobacteria bacterium]